MFDPSTLPGEQWAAYVARDASGAQLYVGKAINLRSRFRTHRAQSQWYPLIATVDFTYYRTEADARAAEKSLIASLQPVWNVQDVPSARAIRLKLRHLAAAYSPQRPYGSGSSPNECRILKPTDLHDLHRLRGLGIDLPALCDALQAGA